MRELLLFCVLCSLFAVGFSVVTLSPTSCAYSSTYTSTYSSSGITTLNIKTVGTTLDQLLLAAPSTTASITINAVSRSSSNVDVNSYVITNSHNVTTLSYTATLPTTKATSTCRTRTVVTVAAPSTVQTICFNGNCYCNCVGRGNGVNIHFATTQANIYNTLNYTGFGSIRMDYIWQATEQTKGVYSYSDFDTLVTNLVSRDMVPYFILDYSNSLYNGGLAPNTAESIQAFASWAANASIHYQGKNMVWEMWNEANLGWTPTVNAGAYANLAMATGKAIKDVTPGEVYIGPATSQYDYNFIQTCFNAGLLNYWDAVSVHFYRENNPETAVVDYFNLRQQIRLSKPSYKQYVPILSGEWGYTTSTIGVYGNEQTELGQAQYASRMLLNNLANDIPISIWYDFIDDSPNNDDESRFGLYRNQYYSSRVPAYDAKPSGLAVKTFFKYIRSLRFNKRIGVSDDSVYVMLYTNAELATSFCIAAWTTGASKSIQIPSSAGSFTVSNMYGNATSTATAASGFVTITVSQSPQYLVPNAANEYLAVIAAIKRLPTEIIGSGSVALPIVVHNPLTRSITVTIGSESAVTLAAGQTAYSSPTVFSDIFTGSPILRSVTIQIAGLGNIALTTYTVYDNPISVYPTQPTASGTIVNILNPTGKAWTGNLSVTANGKATNSAISFTQGQTSALVTVNNNGLNPLTNKYAVAFNLYDSSSKLVSTQSRSLQMPIDLSKYTIGTFPSVLSTYVDGDTSATLTYTIVIATAPAGVSVPTLKFTYTFSAGWKYIMILPSPVTTITGNPTAVGVWIYGDGKNNWANFRFRDSTDQTCQFTWGQIGWTGWKYVTTSMTQTPGCWGGANDGVLHYPVTWDTYFIFDSNQAGSSGTIYFSSPVAIF